MYQTSTYSTLINIWRVYVRGGSARYISVDLSIPDSRSDPAWPRARAALDQGCTQRAAERPADCTAAHYRAFPTGETALQTCPTRRSATGGEDLSAPARRSAPAPAPAPATGGATALAGQSDLPRTTHQPPYLLRSCHLIFRSARWRSSVWKCR